MNATVTSPRKKLSYTVTKVNCLTVDIFQVFLMPQGLECLDYQAGQYLEILPSDQILRAFSIANAPTANGLLELHIRHTPLNPYTQVVFDQITKIGQLEVIGPFGNNTLCMKPAYPWLFVAGGTGFAPIKALIEAAIAQDIKRPMYFYWGISKPCDLYLLSLAQTWADSLPHFNFVPVLSVADATWTGRQGWLHEAVLQDFSDFSQFHIYAAGPNEMVYAARDSFQTKGLNATLMYSDTFGKP